MSNEMRWWDRHQTPIFFPWIWFLFLCASFAGGVLLGVLIAVWTLAARGLV